MVRSLLNAGLAEEIPAPIDDAGYLWRQGDDGSDLMLRATDLGLARITEAEGSVPAPHPTETTIVAGAETDRALALEQPLVGDVPTGVAQAGQDVTQVPSQPEATPAATNPFDAVQEVPAVPVRAVRQSRLRQAAQALLKAWEEAASADVVERQDVLDEHFAALRAALAMEASASSRRPIISAHRGTPSRRAFWPC